MLYLCFCLLPYYCHLHSKIFTLYSASSGKNPGLLAIWEEERQRRKSENDSSHITPVPSQGDIFIILIYNV